MSILKFCYYEIGKVNVELLRETVGMTGICKSVFWINMVQLLHLVKIWKNVYRIIESKKYEENECSSVCNGR